MKSITQEMFPWSPTGALRYLQTQDLKEVHPRMYLQQELFHQVTRETKWVAIPVVKEDESTNV